MPEITDPVWSVVGVIATIIFGVVGVLGVMFNFLQFIQGRKTLSYEVQSITPVFTIAEKFQEQLEIKLGGEVIRDAYLAIIRFVNTGKASIRPDDFIQPLKLSIRNGRIINANISFTNPPGLEEVIQSRDETEIVFKKILLNSKDEFVLQILLSDFKGKDADIKVDGRIEGVKSVRRRNAVDTETVYNAMVNIIDNRITMAIAIALLIIPIYYYFILPFFDR